MIGSSTVILSTLVEVVVPLTTKLPVIIALPDMFKLTPPRSPVADTLPVPIAPVTVSAVREPTVVMLVWAGVPSIPFNVVAVTVGADRISVSGSNVKFASAPNCPA